MAKRRMKREGRGLDEPRSLMRFGAIFDCIAAAATAEEEEEEEGGGCERRLRDLDLSHSQSSLAQDGDGTAKYLSAAATPPQLLELSPFPSLSPKLFLERGSLNSSPHDF